MLNLSLPSLNEQTVFNESFTDLSVRRTIPIPKNSLKKRLFDVVVSSLIILAVLIWLIPIIGLLIRLTSPGPILFIQLRTGRNGKPFRCLKFRTMIHQNHGPFRQATHNDNRVTTIGRVLRKTNLDEIPQAFNVLLGQMSIVGPRPHAVQHDAQFWNTMPGYADRYAVKPGITGLAQVRGCRGETPKLIQMEHRVRLDRFYIKKRSIGLDLKICWYTAYCMIKGDKNAF